MPLYAGKHAICAFLRNMRNMLRSHVRYKPVSLSSSFKLRDPPPVAGQFNHCFASAVNISVREYRYYRQRYVPLYKYWLASRSIVSLISRSCGNIAQVPKAHGPYSRNWETFIDRWTGQISTFIDWWTGELVNTPY